MKSVTPILLVVLAIGLFFVYVDPTYEKIKVLKEEEAKYDEALDRSRELRELRDSLVAKYNAIPSEDLQRMEKLLPDDVDNVRLLLDINSVAGQYGMSLKDIRISDRLPVSEDVFNADAVTHESIELSFNVTGPYDTFVRFLQDLEESLRIVEVKNIQFVSADVDLSQYQVVMETFWLK